MKPLQRSFTVSIDIENGTNEFPATLAFSDRNIYGVMAHLNNAADTRVDKNGNALLDHDSFAFVRLQGTENCDANIQHIPIEALSVEGTNLAYIPLSIGKIDRSNCEVVVASYDSVKDGSKVVLLTFITD